MAGEGVMSALRKLPPDPAQVAKDLKQGLRDAMRETLATARWHMEMADQYLEQGHDYGEHHHAVQMLQCFKAYLATHNELAALSEKGGD
jgi:hypothetical protein